MPVSSFGSLTKEPPLSTLDATLQAAKPGMNYADLLAFARADGSTHKDAPGLISKRFLLVDSTGKIAYDYFLSLLNTHDIRSPFIRKVMYFVWAYRDETYKAFHLRTHRRQGRQMASFPTPKQEQFRLL